MKTLFSLLILIALLGSCSLEQASPADYNDAFYREQMKIKEKIMQLAKTTDPARQKAIVEELKTQSVKSLERIEEIGSFRGDEQLYKGAVKLFEFYKVMAHEGLSEDDVNISARLDQWRQRLSDEEHEFFKSQAKFAEEYDLFL